jgi:tellurite resistance protein TerC
VFAGVTMLLPRKETPVEKKRIVRWTRRLLPLSSSTNSRSLIVRENGRLMFTYLFLVLVIVELTDLVFALDSVPAVFGVTRDPFIVYTSNICAILGLRALYFLLAGAIGKLSYLHAGLAAVLVFIGAKMIGENYIHLSTAASLGVVSGILACAVAISLLHPRKAATSHA